MFSGENEGGAPAMHGWEVFPNNKRCSMQKKVILVKLIYSIKTNMITSIFPKFLVRFLRNNIKYVVSRAVSRALMVSVLRATTFRSTFTDEGKNKYTALKLMG